MEFGLSNFGMSPGWVSGSLGYGEPGLRLGKLRGSGTVSAWGGRLGEPWKACGGDFLCFGVSTLKIAKENI